MNKLNELVTLLRAYEDDYRSPFKLEGPINAGAGDLKYPTEGMVERTELYDAHASVGRSTVAVTLRCPRVTPVDDYSIVPAVPPTIDDVVNALHQEATRLAAKKLFAFQQEVKQLTDALEASGVACIT